MTKGRKLLVVAVVAVVATALMVPMVAEAQGGPVAWGWSTFTERLVGLTDGLHGLFATLVSAESDAEPLDAAPSAGDDQTVVDGPTTGTNGFPLIDPDG